MKCYRTLDRYISKELAGPFLFGVMAFSLIMVAGGLLFKLADLIIERGVSLAVAGRLFVYELPGVVVLTLPMSCLLGALLGFGAMSTNSEVVALKASGISFWRMNWPVIFWAVIISILSLILNETLVPLGQRAAENVMTFEVAKQKPVLIKQEVFLQAPGGRVVYVGKLDPSSGSMSNVIVQELASGKLTRITVAPNGQWVSGIWYLTDGDVYEMKEPDGVAHLFHFAKQELPISLTPRQIANTSVKPDDLSVSDLYRYIAAMKMQGKDISALWVKFHFKLAVPWACVILSLIGTSLGVSHQRHGNRSVGFGQSILIVFLYYVLMSVGKSLGQANALPPVVAGWLPNIIFLVAAVFLIRRADR